VSGGSGGVREAAVLSGGRSRRMGAEKALLDVGGASLLERALRAFGERFQRLLVSVSSEGPSASCEEVVLRARREGLRVDVVADLRAARDGPLAGIEAILAALEGPAALFVPADAPAIEPRLIDALLSRAAGDVRGVVPCWSGGVEPLFAVYGRGLLDDVRELLDRGRPEARGLAGLGGVEVVPLERLAPGLDPREVFRNLNTPADYRAWLDGRR